MPEPEKSDRWNSLLETLGVPASEPAKSVPPEASLAGAELPTAPSRPQPVSLLPPEKPKAAPKPKPAPPAAKSPSYWSRIAGALGLETPADPEPEAAAETPPAPPPRPVEPAARPPRAERPRAQERPQRPAREPEQHRPGDLPARAFEPPPPRPSAEAPPRSSLGSMFGPPTSDLDVFGLGGPSGQTGEREEAQTPAPRHREPAPSRSRAEEQRSRAEEQRSRAEEQRARGEEQRGRAEEPRRRDEGPRRALENEIGSAEEPRGPVLDYDAERGSDLALPEESGPARPAPREERGEEGEGRRRRRRRGRGRRGRGEGRTETGDLPPRRTEDAPPPELEAEFDLERDEELDLELERDEELFEQPRREDLRESPPAGERPDRGGRRRRGRRGAGRDREQPAGERQADYGQPEFEDEGVAADRPPPPARAARRDEPRGQSAGGLRELEEHDDLDGEGDEGHASGAPTHKRIPTWEEAIGILIETNMAARANSPERDPYRGGRGRGRGRGGRGR